VTQPESQEPDRRPWYAQIVCPVCYGPVRVPPHTKEGRCRGCRPVRDHSPRRRPAKQSTETYV
jgi:hypothetical protein